MSTATNNPAPKSAPDESRIVAGYRVGEEMGRGPLGTIYRAENAQTGAKVVFRGFTRPEGADPEKWEAAKNQFHDLLRAHQAIDKHPIIQDIEAFGEENGIFWIATEYFEGRTLQQIMASEGAKPLAWCLEVMTQVADAVDYAAEQGLTHTDLTPYNVLLVNHPESPDRVEVRVINFGLAHARPKHGSRYAAPEQQSGADGDRASDVFAVGTLLYELVSGKPAFTGTTPGEVAQKVRTEDPVQTLVNLPAYVRNVLGAMLAKEPRFRYSSVGRAVDDLQNKRSPDGADRFDSVEMNTAEMLEARRMERKSGLTAQDELAGAWREAGAAPGRALLQEYRLSEMDVLEIKWKAEREARRREDERERTRDRWMPLVRWGVGLGAASLLLTHAANIVPNYSRATVLSVSGTVTRQPETSPGMPDAKPVPIKPGETLSAKELPQFLVTGADSGATLTLASGEAVYIPANSGIEVRELGYKNGAVRDFVVWYGRATFRATQAVSGKKSFTVQTPEGVTTKLVGDTRAQVGTSPLGKAPRVVMVAAQTADLPVTYPGGETKLKPGNRFVMTFPGGQTEETLSTTDATLAADNKAFAAVPEMPGFVRFLAGVEENTLLPVVSAAKSIWAIPTSMNDGKNIALATTSMQALCTLVQAGGGEGGAPETLDLQTLAPLSLADADKKRMLQHFDGAKLIAYRTLPNGGYEILARATDSQHTWIRGKNGGASAAGTGQEPAK